MDFAKGSTPTEISHLAYCIDHVRRVVKSVISSRQQRENKAPVTGRQHGRATRSKASTGRQSKPLTASLARPATTRSRKWSPLLNRRDVLIVDTETTGLSKRAEVIEIVALDTTGTVRFHALSMPQEAIPVGASNIHGLTRAHLRKLQATPWPHAHSKLAPILENANVLVAWNASFDRRLLEQTTARHGLHFGVALPWRDALKDYKAFRPGLGSYSLGNVMRSERLRFDGQAHRAEADCRAVLSIMRSVSKRES